MPFAVAFIGPSSDFLHVDGPLERVGRPMVVRPPALPELLDDPPPRLDGAVLAELEFGPSADDLKPHRSELGQRSLIQRIRRVERLEPALGLITREEDRKSTRLNSSHTVIS